MPDRTTASNPIESVPCRLCGKPTQMLGTKLCDPCYEHDRVLTPIERKAEEMWGMLREIAARELVHSPGVYCQCSRCHDIVRARAILASIEGGFVRPRDKRGPS